MRNKELKVGDKVWVFSAYMSHDKSGYTVKSVKKNKTLVTVVAEACFLYPKEKPYDITLYGHCNSKLLSSYDRKWGRDDDIFVCDFDLIIKRTKITENNERLMDAGETLLNIAKYFK
jgi:hypothetical protein